jgi:hypothetical protein
MHRFKGNVSGILAGQSIAAGFCTIVISVEIENVSKYPKKSLQ